jgi:hypothetical protein
VEIHSIEMERGAARKALLDYRRDLKESRERSRTELDQELAAVDAAVMRGYRELGKGHRVIELSKVISAGGVTKLEDVTVTFWKEDGRWEAQVDLLAPALAVTRADARQCWTVPLYESGRSTLSFQADGWQWHPRKKDRVSFDLETIFDVEVELQLAEIVYGRNERSGLNNVRLKAMAPTIPPVFRPPHALHNYHLLWEAEWTVGAMLPPGDPALLKHLGGDLFAVLAVWELSDLEKAALAQVRA